MVGKLDLKMNPKKVIAIILIIVLIVNLVLLALGIFNFLTFVIVAVPVFFYASKRKEL